MPLEMFFDLQRKRHRQFASGQGAGVESTNRDAVTGVGGACSNADDVGGSNNCVSTHVGTDTCDVSDTRDRATNLPDHRKSADAAGGIDVDTGGGAITGNENAHLPHDAVYYLSHQNSNLTEELSPLLDCASSVDGSLR